MISLAAARAFYDVRGVLGGFDFFNFGFELNLFFDFVFTFGAILVITIHEAGEFTTEAFDEVAQNVGDDEQNDCENGEEFAVVGEFWIEWMRHDFGPVRDAEIKVEVSHGEFEAVWQK